MPRKTQAGHLRLSGAALLLSATIRHIFNILHLLAPGYRLTLHFNQKTEE
jgi:hypothetical protein